MVFVIDFREIRHMDAETFVRDVLIGCFHAVHAGCGFNYHFGSGALGNGEILGTLCRKYGITETTQPQLCYGDKPVSSTRIRKSIASGDISSANAMLGRKYGFADITTVEEYQKRVPVIVYDHIAEAIERMCNGEQNVLTAYPYRHMNETSGTIGVVCIAGG